MKRDDCCILSVLVVNQFILTFSKALMAEEEVDLLHALTRQNAFCAKKTTREAVQCR